MKTITVFIGGFGSGKTECAINFAMEKGKEGFKTILIDLDIVNPMFRSSIHESMLKNSNVELITSESMHTCEGLPIVSADVTKVFFDDTDWSVFDVGGDEIGSTALGQYHHYFVDTTKLIQIWFVINTRRPSTTNVKDICALVDRVQNASRLKIDGFINNTNLSYESNAELLMEGNAVLKEVSTKIGKPILFTAAVKKVSKELSNKYSGAYEGELMMIERRMVLPWS